jgi:hypothetical protein
VIDAGAIGDAGNGAGDDVGFGRMKIAARRIDAQRPARAAEFLPRRESQRVAEQMADLGVAWRGVGARRQRNFRCAAKRSERIRLRCPVQITKRSGKPMKVMFGAVVIGGDADR